MSKFKKKPKIINSIFIHNQMYQNSIKEYASDLYLFIVELAIKSNHTLYNESMFWSDFMQVYEKRNHEDIFEYVSLYTPYSFIDLKFKYKFCTTKIDSIKHILNSSRINDIPLIKTSNGDEAIIDRRKFFNKLITNGVLKKI